MLLGNSVQPEKINFYLIYHETKNGKNQCFFVKWNLTAPWQVSGNLKLEFFKFSIKHIPYIFQNYFFLWEMRISYP